jgi:hypothetical protein
MNLMKHLVIAGVMAACLANANAVEKPVVVDGVAYGPRLHLSGIYFTNFENSKFFECAGTTCASWSSGEGETLSCAQRGCNDLETRIRTLNGSHDRWGTYRMTFIGRRSIGPHAKKFINDTTYSVLLEEITNFDLFESNGSKP